MAGKLSKALSSIADILGNPWLLNHIYDRNEAWNRRFKSEYGKTNGLPILAYKDIVGKTSSLDVFSFAGGGSLPTDLALLKSLSNRSKGHRYFEIGTWQGESVSAVASAFDKCYTLDLDPEHLRAAGAEDSYINRQGYFSEKLENVVHLKGDSRTFDFGQFGQAMDLIFIDGDHHYESVKQDTKNVFQYLTDGHSIVVWHDYAFGMNEVRWEVFKGIMDGIPTEFHDRLFTVESTLCAIFLPRPFSIPPPTTEPQGYFEVSLNYKYDSKD